MPEAIDICPKKDGGVMKEIIQEGIGVETPTPGSNVKVHYTGTLLDGSKFDSSRDRDRPFEFNLGKGSVIKAWDIGVATMRKGERAILTCAPQYAYGESGSPPAIPPNSTLKFDVEVLDWTGEDLSPKKDGGIERIQITPGEGYANPNDGALVQVHLTGKFGDKVFEDRDVSFNVGEGSEENILKGVEIALESFKRGETSKLIIKPQYAFGAKGSDELGIPPNATLEYIVTLKNFEKSKESWALNDEEKVQQAKLFKEKGTHYFKEQKYQLAIKMYKKIVDYLKEDGENIKKAGDESRSLLLSAHLNMSLCYLKIEEFFEARNEAANSLKIDPNNEKALFRHGKALLELGEPILASGAFQKCLQIDPNNSAAKQQNMLCLKRMKAQLQQEKRIYANMFDKFAKMDTQREEFEMKKQPNVMSSVGEWGAEDREREPSEFERENPDILLLNKTGDFKDM
ncbi:hypothetical protein HHI36_009678 [Cryptolaemus montrouzieri]|uniref:peptidylprolyl isomerase n=1 Tax=Cryptolaemus montrouzieri TaxID=559131 RepID=A0ABD2MGI9_9CUCU